MYALKLFCALSLYKLDQKLHAFSSINKSLMFIESKISYTLKHWMLVNKMYVYPCNLELMIH